MPTPDPGIYILTGPVQSGKTTALIQWLTQRNDVNGILTPVVDGKRVFMNAATKEQFAMEATGNEEAVSIGRFVFSKRGFNKAAQIIRGTIDENSWLIIDEIGPLEMRGEGFFDAFKEVLAKRNKKLLLVIREGLVNEVIEKFSVIGPVIINNPENLQ